MTVSPLRSTHRRIGRQQRGRGHHKAATEPFYGAGRERIAANIMRRAIGKEGTKPRRCTDDGVNSDQNTCRGNSIPGAANLEAIYKEIGDEGGNVLVKDQIAADESVKALSRVAPGSFTGMEPSAYGATIQEGAVGTKAAEKEALKKSLDFSHANRAKEIDVSRCRRAVPRRSKKGLLDLVG